MDQLPLNYEEREEREAAADRCSARLGLREREGLVLRLLAGYGEAFSVGVQAAGQLSITRANAARILSCGANTFARGAADLEAAGLVHIMRETRPWTYLVNWSRIARLAPRRQPDIADIAIFAQSSAQSDPPKIHPDPPRSTAHTINQETSKTHKPSHCIPSHDGRPLVLGQLDNQLLRAAVAGPDRSYLAQIFGAAVEQGKLENTREDRRKFLAAAHHAVTCSKIHNPAGALYAAISSYFKPDRTTEASQDWAGSVLSARERRRLENA